MSEVQPMTEFISADSMAVVERDGVFFINVVDENTGELIEKMIGEVDPRKALYGIARDIRRRVMLVENVKYQEQREIEHIKAVAMARMSDHSGHITTLQEHAQSLVDVLAQAQDAPLDKREMPYFEVTGVGKFHYRLGSERIDAVGYERMDAKAQSETQNAFPDLFKTKTVVTPDKAAIKRTLKDDGLVKPGGFALTGGQLGFTFKGE